jgi:hypothetical protein
MLAVRECREEQTATNKPRCTAINAKVPIAKKPPTHWSATKIDGLTALAEMRYA